MSENWKIQISPKLPDGTLVNLRAENAGEMEQILDWATANAQLITDTAALLIGARNAAPVTQPQAQQPQAQQPSGWSNQPQPQVVQFPPQQQQGTGGPVCEHGAYVWKDFVSKKGNAVKGFFCPGQNTQCQPDFRK